MSDELLDLFNNLSRGEHTPTSRKDIIKAPFGWPGGKSKNMFNILKHLPYANGYCEPCGGSFAIGLAREKSKLEVYNDAYGGVVEFYRCLRDPASCDGLIAWLENTVHAREEFYTCRDTWQDCKDPIERAGRWYYSIRYSFGSKGKDFGRSCYGVNAMSGKVINGIKAFKEITKRLEGVLVENGDCFQIIKDFDAADMVFYIDPPYLNSTSTHYEEEWNLVKHERLLDLVFSSKGFFAVSGYPHELYDKYPWDNKHEFQSFLSSDGMSFREEGGREEELAMSKKRGHTTECLWTKEAR